MILRVVAIGAVVWLVAAVGVVAFMWRTDSRPTPKPVPPVGPPRAITDRAYRPSDAHARVAVLAAERIVGRAWEAEVTARRDRSRSSHPSQDYPEPHG